MLPQASLGKHARDTTMLVLSRKVGERIRIGENICVTVVRIAQNGVRIGIEAPPEFTVVREELEAGESRAVEALQAKPR